MVVQSRVPESEAIRLLDARHVPFLSELECRLLAALEFGYDRVEMASDLGFSLATIDRHLAGLRQRVLDPTGLPARNAMLNHWTRRHFKCCTEEAQKMIESCQIFG